GIVRPGRTGRGPGGRRKPVLRVPGSEVPHPPAAAPARTRRQTGPQNRLRLLRLLIRKAEMTDFEELQLDGDLEFDNLEFEVEDGIAVITLNRPDALNALNSDLMLEFGLALDVAAGSDGVRALILTG